MTEADIITGCANAERKAQQELYARYSPLMFGICLRYMRNRQDAEDILQEGFIRIYGAIACFKHLGSFEGWLKRIMVNTAIEYLRKKSILTDENDVSELQQGCFHDFPSDSLEVEDLMKIMHEMPTGYRVVLNLYAIEGYSHKEIAEMLKVSEGTSKSQLAKARNYMMKKLLVENNE